MKTEVETEDLGKLFHLKYKDGFKDGFNRAKEIAYDGVKPHELQDFKYLLEERLQEELEKLDNE